MTLTHKYTLLVVLITVVTLAAAEPQYGYGPYPAPSKAAAAPSASGEEGEYGPGGEYGGSGSANGNEYGSYKISSRSATIAHAACGALATLLFLPLGVLVARSRLPRWFPVHAVNQFLAVVLVSSAFGIAWSHFSRGLNTPHRRAATSLFALVIAQALLGGTAHYLGPRIAPNGRSVFHYVHWGLGLVVIGLGWAVAYLGLTSEWAYRGHGTPAHGWLIGWGVVVALWGVAYLLGLGLLPRQLRREKEGREEIMRSKEITPLTRASS